MYMDAYKTDELSWQSFARQCPVPWGGITFAPHKVGTEGYHSIQTMIGTCFLDEPTYHRYSVRHPDKLFQLLPDITNVQTSATLSILASTILQRAQGRRIVLLAGSIGGQKNLENWCRLIAKADPRDWFFAQLGKVHYSSLSISDFRGIYHLMCTPPENVFLSTNYIADERALNDVFLISDIIFAVYRRFSYSSNMLAKAAWFHKLLLVAQSTSLADSVERYGIGLAVPRDDVGAMLAALNKLRAAPKATAKYDALKQKLHPNAMADALETFLNGVGLSPSR
jgi:hypothetical protein